MSSGKFNATTVLSFASSIKGKIAILVTIPFVALVILLVPGRNSPDELSTETKRLVEEEFQPLINDDFETINHMRASIKDMLEADHDVHQAFIAEQAI